MIPVLIVLGSAAASAAGLFVGAAATAAAHEVVQESKDELNAINADMQKMTEDANSAIASCKETYSVSMEKFDDARTNAYLSVLPEFTQVMSNIKHTEMGGDMTQFCIVYIMIYAVKLKIWIAAWNVRDIL